MRGFADHEFLMPITLGAITLAICLPIVQAMRSSALSLALGVALIATALLLVLGPWLYSERRGRRMLKELLDKEVVSY